MAKRKANATTKSTVKVSDVHLTETQLRTLSGLMTDLNGGVTDPSDLSEAPDALAECAVRYLDEHAIDYTPNARPILHGAPPPAPLAHFDASEPHA